MFDLSVMLAWKSLGRRKEVMTAQHDAEERNEVLHFKAGDIVETKRLLRPTCYYLDPPPK